MLRASLIPRITFVVKGLLTDTTYLIIFINPLTTVRFSKTDIFKTPISPERK